MSTPLYCEMIAPGHSRGPGTQHSILCNNIKRQLGTKHGWHHTCSSSSMSSSSSVVLP